MMWITPRFSNKCLIISLSSSALQLVILQFYNILEVDKSASDVIIKKAFRKQAMKHHPDKGGDAEKVILTEPPKK